MITRTAICAGLLSQASIAFAVVHDKLTALPLGWSAAEKPADSSMISLTIGLQMQNLDQLEQKLAAVSTPGSEEYGQYLDIDDVNSIFAPSTEATTAVQSWLTNAGVNSMTSDGYFVSFATDVKTANSLLDTTFMNFQNDGTSKLRTMQYSIPSNLTQYIDLITPMTYFGKTVASIPKATHTKRREIPTKRHIDASCQTSITPTCLKEMYNIRNYTPSVKSGSKIGFGSFLNQSAIYSDLFQFENYFKIPHQDFSVELINGGKNDQNPLMAQIAEANLDVENIVGLAHPLPVVEYITGGSPPYIPDLGENEDLVEDTNEPYIPYYQYLLSKKNSELPQVISNSYGDDEQTVPYKYAVRTCNMIGMMGLRGITVLESSGDTGVGAACRSNDGTNATQFMPQFPGTCPYITAVGGTQAVIPEVAWNASSGGMSFYFPRAWYQEQAVNTYLNNYISPETKAYYESYTNFSGRAFPDISAHSLYPRYQIIRNGSLAGSGGTSAAAPVWAAIVGLLNDARLLAGKPQLGFLNPLFYSINYSSGALNDIIGGAALGCNGVNLQTGDPVVGGGVIPYASWNSTIGWDPATGLGTPNFEKLKELVLNC